MTKKLSGMYAALMTGLSDDGEFDPQRQRNINDYVLRQGLAGSMSAAAAPSPVC